MCTASSAAQDHPILAVSVQTPCWHTLCSDAKMSFGGTPRGGYQGGHYSEYQNSTPGSSGRKRHRGVHCWHSLPGTY